MCKEIRRFLIQSHPELYILWQIYHHHHSLTYSNTLYSFKQKRQSKQLVKNILEKCSSFHVLENDWKIDWQSTIASVLYSSTIRFNWKESVVYSRFSLILSPKKKSLNESNQCSINALDDGTILYIFFLLKSAPYVKPCWLLLLLLRRIISYAARIKGNCNWH